MTPPNKITIQHNEGFATTVFILQNIIAIILCVYLLYKYTQDYSILNLLIVMLCTLVILRLGKYLKAVYLRKKYIISDDFLEVQNKRYPLDKISFSYLPTTFTSLLAAKLYLKETDEEIGIVVFSFWAGTLLNITPESFEAIFKESSSQKNNISIESIDMQKESREIKQTDTAWYIVYAVFFIPVIFIWYLMTKS
ncbi:MAG: hypothetical protein GXO11_08330 [Epsilonproteobacteria bacterium]|nr:hypothetical protein [Campylobacterota bacterium]